MSPVTFQDFLNSQIGYVDRNNIQNKNTVCGKDKYKKLPLCTY